MSLKYAHVERERRSLLASSPSGLAVESTQRITHRYVIGAGAEEVANTNLYLDEAEWAALSVLPGDGLRKERRKVRLDGVVVAVDVFAGHCEGLVLSEVDRGDGEDVGLPDGLPVIAEVTGDEFFTGGALAAASRDDVLAALRRFRCGVGS